MRPPKISNLSKFILLELAYLHCNFNEYMFHLNQLDVNVDLKKF